MRWRPTALSLGRTLLHIVLNASEYTQLGFLIMQIIKVIEAYTITCLKSILMCDRQAMKKL